MERLADSAYCYYHDKLQTGLTTPHLSTVIIERETFDQEGHRTVSRIASWVTRFDCYPVWPLPKRGYVLLVDPEYVRAA